MDNYKVKVESEVESEEVQELFFDLGYVDRKGWTKRNPIHESIQAWSDGEFTFSLSHDQVPVGFKEITIQQLKDMVVLKRNDVGDATHGNAMYSYVKLSDGWYYFDKGESNKWIKSVGGKRSYYENLKPIEKKEMKEFLVNHDGKWTLQLLDSDTEENSYRVAVPSGATHYSKGKYSGNGVFLKVDGINKYEYYNNTWLLRCNPLNEMYFTTQLLWQRSETEYLMNGENGEKLMESIAQLKNQDTVKVTIDELRHRVGVEPNKTTVGKLNSQWDFQVGGDHYKSMKIQPAKFALENKLDYCQANAIKYICRHDSKNGKQDLEKAKHYIDLLIEHYYGDEDE